MSLDLSETRDPRDVDLLTRARIALGLRKRLTLRSIRIEVSDGIATLEGRVPTFYDRQLAVTTVQRVAGMTAVRDRIAVINKNDVRPPEAVVPAKESQVVAPRVSKSGAFFKIIVASWVLATVVSLAGCSEAPLDRVSVFPVAGQVQLNGKPLANAYVVLHPRNPPDQRTLVASGKTDQQGKFQLLHSSHWEMVPCD